MHWRVPYINLGESYKSNRDEITDFVEKCFSSGEFILREELTRFEQNMAKFLGVKHVIGVNSGTDALLLSCFVGGLRPNNEVITVAHTFVATVAAIRHCRATPVFADIGSDFNINVDLIEPLINSQTRAILPVHLNGRSCNMKVIMDLAKKYDLLVIEDAAQSVGAKFNNKCVGTFGELGCFSLHPMKSLSVPGDGGFIATNSDDFCERLRSLRNHGQSADKKQIYEFGFSSRLDNFHAGIANIKLRSLNQNNFRRRQIASLYHELLTDIPILLPPPPNSGIHHDVFNSFVIRTVERDKLKEHLIDAGIEVFVHMTKPLTSYPNLNLPSVPLTNNEKICSEILSLPIYPELTDDGVHEVTNAIRGFFK